MPERDYSHRTVVDKLGIKQGHAIAIVPAAGPLDEELEKDILDRAHRPPADDDEPADIVLITADASTDVLSLLHEWRSRIVPAGGIWVLTPKRSQPGYLNQSDLIPMGVEAGLVDNKICSVSDTSSGMRFVIRCADRPR